MTPKTVDPETMPLEEQVERWKHLAETMRDSAERYKAERDELLEQLPMMQLAEQFMANFMLFQQRFMQNRPEGYTVTTPNGPMTFSTGMGTTAKVE